MNNTEPEYVSCIDKGCQAWRQGDDLNGVGWFQQACILWLETLEQDEHDIPSLFTLEQCTGLLKEVLDSLNASDIIKATDLLEHELLPMLKGTNPREERS